MTKQRAYMSGVNVTLFGLVNLQVDAMPVKAKDANKAREFHLIAPAAVISDAIQLEQRFVIPDGVNVLDSDGNVDPSAQRVFTKDECDRGYTVEDESLVRVSDEARDEVLHGAEDTRLPDNDIQLRVFKRADLDAETVPAGNAYRIRPHSKKGKINPQHTSIYLMIRDLVASQPDLVFVGELTSRSVQNMYRLDVRDGQLVLVGLIRPGDLAESDEINGEYDAALLAKAEELMAGSVEEFNGEEFANQVKVRAEAFAAEQALIAAGGTPIAPVALVAPKADKTDSMLDLLDAAIAAKAA